MIDKVGIKIDPKPLAITANTKYTSQYEMFEQLRYTVDELFVTTRNLATGYEVADAVLCKRMPNLMLQTLVENSILH